MLISSYHERQTRNSEKIRQLLNFLKEETYSDFKTLMQLFSFRDHKSLYSLLAKMERMGLIQKHMLESRTIKISLWGITSDGLAAVLTPNDKIFPARFEPSKITGWTLEHHLDNQAARLILEKKGASGWINGDRASFLSQYQVKHRPDGLLTLPDGNVIAIETERRLKTRFATSRLSPATCWPEQTSTGFTFFMLCPIHRRSVRLNCCLTVSGMSSSTISTSRWKNATVGCFAFIPLMN